MSEYRRLVDALAASVAEGPLDAGHARDLAHAAYVAGSLAAWIRQRNAAPASQSCADPIKAEADAQALIEIAMSRDAGMPMPPEGA